MQKLTQRMVVRSEVTAGRNNPDKVSIDGFLGLLIEVYQETKKRVVDTLRWERSLVDLISMKEAEELVSRVPRWREQLPALTKELGPYFDPTDGERMLRVDTLLSVLLDLNIYREGDAHA